MQKEDVGAVVNLLVKAFMHTAFYGYIAPNLAERAHFLQRMFHYRVSQGFGHNQTSLAIDRGEISGAATWVPPVLTETGFLQSGISMDEALMEVPAEIRARWFGFLKILTHSKDSCVRQPYWSLSPIAVSPEMQGKGIASQLLKMKFEETDTESVPCFLSTQDAANRDIYVRYGFQTKQEDKLDHSDIITYTMIRPAASLGKE